MFTLRILWYLVTSLPTSKCRVCDPERMRIVFRFEYPVLGNVPDPHCIALRHGSALLSDEGGCWIQIRCESEVFVANKGLLLPRKSRAEWEEWILPRLNGPKMIWD
jgi:hypothetical protein